MGKILTDLVIENPGSYLSIDRNGCILFKKGYEKLTNDEMIDLHEDYVISEDFTIEEACVTLAELQGLNVEVWS